MELIRPIALIELWNYYIHSEIGYIELMTCALTLIAKIREFTLGNKGRENM